jgi:aminoglycoside 3-N-acetyltransferase
MALVDVVGVEGTIVMPAQTGVSDPANWRNPPVPQAWWPTIRSDWPAFDPFVTPLRGMGAVVECFQHLPHVLHCGHPATGFVARGPLAASIVASHPLEESLGDPSPLGRLYDADARVVLIGVGHANNTSLHLAEHRAEYPGKAMKAEGAPLMVDGVRRWVTYMDLDRDEEDFVALGDAFLASGGSEEQASLGYGRVITYSMRDIVDFGTRWLTETRSKLAGFGP